MVQQYLLPSRIHWNLEFFFLFRIYLLLPVRLEHAFIITTLKSWPARLWCVFSSITKATDQVIRRWSTVSNESKQPFGQRI